MKKFPLFLLVFFVQQTLAQNSIDRFDSLTREYEKNNFQGVILVAKGDQIIYNKAWGYADLDNRIKLRNNSLFKTESTGKMYTATAIMQLVEQGKLKLTQTVKELLPSLNLKNADKITVHHLLTHTSGLQSPWDDPQYDFKKAYTRPELETLITQMPLVFEPPGKEMYYSNSGYIILSWIVEMISGQSFDDYLAAHFFKPQQMKCIRHLDDTLMPAGEAQPYRFVNSTKYISLNEMLGPKANGAGGWVASATDLYRFMLGFDQNKYFSAGSLYLMRTANATKPLDSVYRSYAYGLETYNNDPIRGTSFFGHSGGGAGFSIDAILDPVTHTIVIFCSNTYTNSRSVSNNFLRIALDKPAEQIKIANSVKAYDLIEAKGITNFIKNEKENFQSLNIIPDERLFTSVADAMEMAEDFNSLARWMELGHVYFPENGFILLMAGTGQSHIGENDKALESYEAAKAIAGKKNDVRMMEELERRIKKL